MAGDPHDLQRFVDAQADSYATALAEIRAGAKQSHWIWYVLPQLRGLGLSSMATHYGITSIDEARAYLAHPLLGPRLQDCVASLLALPGLSAQQVLGTVDAMKLRSCLTLFAAVAGEGSVFDRSLRRFFGGQADARTLALLAHHRGRAR